MKNTPQTEERTSDWRTHLRLKNAPQNEERTPDWRTHLRLNRMLYNRNKPGYIHQQFLERSSRSCFTYFWLSRLSLHPFSLYMNCSDTTLTEATCREAVLHQLRVFLATVFIAGTHVLVNRFSLADSPHEVLMGKYWITPGQNIFNCKYSSDDIQL